MKQVIKIGTRDSPLALWQAGQAEDALHKAGYDTEIVPVKSEGDLNLSVPIYEMGVQGVFTRFLDAAVLAKKVDIAVHSMKDVPVVLANGLAQAAVLKRDVVKDLLVYNQSASFLKDTSAAPVIATGSIRRKAQWLNRYPNSTITGLRGNVNTRLRKLYESNWNGALFSAAGLERIQIRPENSVLLDWMLPAPAQGAILVVCREEDTFCREACNFLNDADAALCTAIERDFLKTLLGGCATPISAYAYMEENNIIFEGNILTPDGKEKAVIKKQVTIEESRDLGITAGREILESGAQKIIDKLQAQEEEKNRP